MCVRLKLVTSQIVLENRAFLVFVDEIHRRDELPVWKDVTQLVAALAAFHRLYRSKVFIYYRKVPAADDELRKIFFSDPSFRRNSIGGLSLSLSLSPCCCVVYGSFLSSPLFLFPSSFLSGEQIDSSSGVV